MCILHITHAYRARSRPGALEQAWSPGAGMESAACYSKASSALSCQGLRFWCNTMTLGLKIYNWLYPLYRFKFTIKNSCPFLRLKIRLKSNKNGSFTPLLLPKVPQDYAFILKIYYIQIRSLYKSHLRSQFKGAPEKVYLLQSDLCTSLLRFGGSQIMHIRVPSWSWGF